MYALLTKLLLPTAWWGRLEVTGLDQLPESGPLLVVPNHDSQWDPVLVGLAMRRRFKLHFLARASLWRIPWLGRVLSSAGQIPIERGAGDAQALAQAIEVLRDGAAICIFAEGRLSRGERLRARTGVARLAQDCPGVRVVLCTVEGTTDYVRFPRRPRVLVTFFSPRRGDPRADEDAQQLASRLLEEIRERVPPLPAGRRAPKALPPA